MQPRSASKKNRLFVSNRGTYQLKASDLRSLILHYQFSKHIQFIMNGRTAYGQKCKSEHRNAIQEKITDFNTSTMKYALYITESWKGGNIKYNNLDLAEHYPKMEAAFKEFLTEDNHFKKMTNDDFKKLNSICQNFPSQLLQILDKKIKEHVADLIENKEDANLTMQEVNAEIRSIQSHLKPGETVGYFFTNFHRKLADHFEPLIITNSSIIRPVTWPGLTNHFKPESDLASITYTTDPVNLGKIPQADRTSCGVLSMLYLKELLENQNYQLNQYTKIIDYYDDTGEIQHLFIPSPHVLRYSQSASFNDLIADLLLNEEESFQLNGQTVQSLASLINASIKKAKERDDHEMVAKNQALLKDLPDFRQKWREAYKQAMDKRANPQLNSEKHNLYLAYHAERMKEMVEYPDPRVEAVLKLEKYIYNRSVEEIERNDTSSLKKLYLSATAPLRINALTKISAAVKVIRILQERNVKPFTTLELDALNEKNSRLQKILAEIKKDKGCKDMIENALAIPLQAKKK